MRHGFLDHHSAIESPIHRLDARAKIIVFFTFILFAVSSPPTSIPFFSILAFSLITITIFARLPLAHLAKKILIVLPFISVVAISIPFMKEDAAAVGYSFYLGNISLSRKGLWMLLNVSLKSSIGVFSIILLSSTTSFPQLIKGMERLHSPKILTVLTSFMYRYSFIIIDEMQRMRRAKDSRSFGGRFFWQLKILGHMVGTLFLRSFYRAERVYLAMLSRGYEGRMPETSGGRFGRGEIIFLTIIPFLLFLRIYLR